MIKNLILLSALTILPFTANAARVAVTDSGTDFSHELLKNQILINDKEIAGNRVDDDRNGKVDDVMGWNFVDDYSRVFFPEHLQYVDEKVFKFMEVIARVQAGTKTKDDELFWKENVTDLTPEKKAALAARLNFYGQYAHSTHVSGIIASIAKNSKIMSNRTFADTPPDEDFQMSMNGESKKKPAAKKAGGGVVDVFYKILAAVANGTFQKVGVYLKEREIDVANYSLGINLQMVAKLSLGLRGIKNPTPEQIAQETQRMIAQFEPAGKAWMDASPNTLFVIAAGNDGTNNDVIAAFPANVRTGNAITVAATNGFDTIAKFSNYGEKTVDIAAPGVAIVSSVPSKDRKKLLPMSGTSMAAPYVAGVAARIKEVNPKLTVADLKQILMSTVDRKDWLKGKVVSEGVVNLERATVAAEKSKTMSVTDAINVANALVKEQTTTIKMQNFDTGEENSISLEMKRAADNFVF